jgi:GNAT superfamily N-acetyltransferase
VRIEIANISHLNVVIGLLRAQFEEHDIGWRPYEMHRAVAEILQDQRWGEFLLAWEKDSAIGLAAITYVWTLEHGGKSAWLDELYVVPDWRDCGVGGALLQKVIELSSRQDCLALDLEVELCHQRAENLYRRMGFTLLPRRRWTMKL